MHINCLPFKAFLPDYIWILLGLMGFLLLSSPLSAQERIPSKGSLAYYFGSEVKFDPAIPSPASFLGYEIGDMHTRHDLMVAYLRELARVSPQADYIEYGRTHEGRTLGMLLISQADKLARQAEISQARQDHLLKGADISAENACLVLNLGYNVHGNEPSGGEAALLTAYYLVAAQDEEAQAFREKAMIFIDPVINPDGRDRHTQWANSHRSIALSADPLDREHNEGWPRGRTNHYWFDLNRDWLLAVHPESQGKLAWYHTWYPHVVTDFHEMGTNSHHFFEPMKPIGSFDPIMPEANYTTLNETFARYFADAMHGLGSLYFTKERFDGTYPGYGSSYPDLQGGLGLLFEQASSRGHLQETDMGFVGFPFTIRNQLTNSLATVRAAVAEEDLLVNYQDDFFTSGVKKGQKDPVKAYVFGDAYDDSRNQAFVELLLRHQIELYPLEEDKMFEGKAFKANKAWIVPTAQIQYRMVQTMFETYEQYRDSVFYDASAWSLVHAFGLPYAAIKSSPSLKTPLYSAESLKKASPKSVKTGYAYLMRWDDYFAPKALYQLHQRGIKVKTALRPFSLEDQAYAAGTLLIPGAPINPDPELAATLQAIGESTGQAFHTVQGGYASNGIDLGSPHFESLREPKALMLIGGGVSSYEAGEVWHLLDTRIGMPITKLEVNMLNRVNLYDYNTIILVSGGYPGLNGRKEVLNAWLRNGGTLISTRQASSWLIDAGLVDESVREAPKDEAFGPERRPYAQASEISGKMAVGGTIFELELDLTHPLTFGLHQDHLPIYRNSKVILEPSTNPYSTPARYTDDPHIDGFVAPQNLEKIKGSAAILVKGTGRGRSILFADNPNFRGIWWGTQRLFLNAIFLGNVVEEPR